MDILSQNHWEFKQSSPNSLLKNIAKATVLKDPLLQRAHHSKDKASTDNRIIFDLKP